jgi:hypothetical protein
MRRILPALLLLLALPAHAEIYKWVDDQGRTHFGEAPPEKYRKSATSVSTTPLNTIQGGVLGRRPEAGKAASAPASSNTAPTPATPEPSESDRCALEHERFYISQACFARFRNANGSLKAEASTQCENVPQPTCSLPR